MPGWLRRRPWLWIVLFWLVVIGANAAFVLIARRNAPEPAPGVPAPDAPGPAAGG